MASPESVHPMISLAALLAFSLSSAAAAPVPDGAMEAALQKARRSFATQQPGQPTLDAVAKLPLAAGPEDPALAAARLALDAAKDVQLGCAAPCSSPADVQAYSGKVESIARRLALKDDQVAAALENYLPNGKPRLRDTAEVSARLMAEQRLAPQTREQLNLKALAMADALGGTTFSDGPRVRSPDSTASRKARGRDSPSRDERAAVAAHGAAEAGPGAGRDRARDR